MKALTWILGIIAVLGVTAAIIFIVKNNRTNKKLIEANAALSALGAPEVKTAQASAGAAEEAGQATGTAVAGTPAGVSA